MNKSDIKICRSSELSFAQKESYCDLFEAIFGKKKSVAEFDRQFLNAADGGAYHGFIELNGRIVASHTLIPYRYLVNGENALFALGCDSMVMHNVGVYDFAIVDIIEELRDKLRSDGYKMIFGFPNDRFYLFNVKILEEKPVGILDFYILPVNVSQIKKSLSWLNLPIRCFSRGICGLLGFFSSSHLIHYPICKVDNKEFRRHRYGSEHHKISFADGCEVFYRLYTERGLGNVAYIIDITKPSQKNFYKSMCAVAKAVKNDASVVAYPCGRLPFRTPFHIPMDKLPRKLRMVANVIDGSEDPDFFYDFSNWYVNLSSFDTR